MISATVYALVVVPVALVSFDFVGLAWASASAVRIDRARAALAAQGSLARPSDHLEASTHFTDRGPAHASPATRSSSRRADESGAFAQAASKIDA